MSDLRQRRIGASLVLIVVGPGLDFQRHCTRIGDEAVLLFLGAVLIFSAAPQTDELVSYLFVNGPLMLVVIGACLLLAALLGKKE
jgi:hypothetical protein